jgi:hypothetical protein
LAEHFEKRGFGRDAQIILSVSWPPDERKDVLIGSLRYAAFDDRPSLDPSQLEPLRGKDTTRTGGAVRAILANRSPINGMKAQE